MKCGKCDGCGKIASDEDGSPWSFWENLKPGEDLAVRLGIVKPIKCPACGGSGEEAKKDKGPAPGVGAGIGEVVNCLRSGGRARRVSWNGKNQWILMVTKGSELWADSFMTEEFVYMEIRREGKEVRIPWVCSQSDLLASDWEVLRLVGHGVWAGELEPDA